MNARDAAAALWPRLEAAGIEDAGFEAEYLVRTAGNLSRVQYFAGHALSPEAEATLERLVRRRLDREPGPYITGEREFWGLPLSVGPGVLVPRPETELLVEVALLELEHTGSTVVADIGTGSGAVAVALACQLLMAAPPRPRRRRAGQGGPCPTHIVATDVSAAALEFARLNAERHGVAGKLAFLAADLASALDRADIVLANLPYVPSGEIDALEPEVSRWEPRVALDGGRDGLGLIRRLVDDCGTRLRPQLLALEVGYGMAGDVEAIAASAGATVDTLPDLAGVERVVCARWR